MDDKTGRCAILFPHGVLFRDEEQAMREELIKLDFLECVIGLGPNLFFNASMEACIIICRKKKSSDRKGKVLFIDAKDEVTRKNADCIRYVTFVIFFDGAYIQNNIIRQTRHAHRPDPLDIFIDGFKYLILGINKKHFSLSIT